MDVLAIKDAVRCPTCGGSDIVYTCEPKCCFNHLCAECRTTFQLLTRRTGLAFQGEFSGGEEARSGDPTAACAVCESLKLVEMADGGRQIIVCADCKAILELIYEDIAAES